MSDMSIIIIVFVAVLGIPTLFALLKSKGIFVSADNMKDMLSITEYIFQKVVPNESQSKMSTVVKLATEAVKYVESVAKTNDNSVKKQLAVDSVIKALTMLNIDIDESDRAIIAVTVDLAVRKLPKTYSENE